MSLIIKLQVGSQTPSAGWTDSLQVTQTEELRLRPVRLMSFKPKDVPGFHPPSKTLTLLRGLQNPRPAPDLVLKRPNPALPSSSTSSSRFPAKPRLDPKRTKRAIQTQLTPAHGHRVLTAGLQSPWGLGTNQGRREKQALAPRPPHAPEDPNSSQPRPGTSSFSREGETESASHRDVTTASGGLTRVERRA
jgi:hypothetical protein